MEDHYTVLRTSCVCSTSCRQQVTKECTGVWLHKSKNYDKAGHLNEDSRMYIYLSVLRQKLGEHGYGVTKYCPAMPRARENLAQASHGSHLLRRFSTHEPFYETGCTYDFTWIRSKPDIFELCDHDKCCGKMENVPKGKRKDFGRTARRFGMSD